MKLNFVFSIALVATLSVIFCSCDYLAKREIIKEGNEIVAKIESFKKDTGRLPESLSEIGVEETEAGPFYIKKDSSRYIVYDALGFDESLVYDSETKKWEEKP